jgi:hypothetical protein
VRGGRELLFTAPADIWIDLDPDEPGAIAAVHQAFIGELGRRLRGAASDRRPEDSAVDIVSLREVSLTPDDRAEAQRIAEDALRRIRALDAAPESGAEPVTLGLFLFRTAAEAPRSRPPDQRDD